MRPSVEFLTGLLDEAIPGVGWDDLCGPQGHLLDTLRVIHALSREPAMNPLAACPHCEDGVPYRLRDRYICHACRSEIAPEHLQLWTLDREGFLRWLAGELRLRGEVRRVDETLWQLGTWERAGDMCESFYLRPGPLSEHGRTRLSAYRNTLVLYGRARPLPDLMPRFSISLAELLRFEERLGVIDLAALLHPGGVVRFEERSGTLHAGDANLGEVPCGSKEFYFLRCLARHMDAYVPYADLKHDVLQASGSEDSTEEATFCHNLKRRIKKKWIPEIDRFLATTNKGDGYRLRAATEPS